MLIKFIVLFSAAGRSYTGRTNLIRILLVLVVERSDMGIGSLNCIYLTTCAKKGLPLQTLTITIIIIKAVIIQATSTTIMLKML